MAERIWKNQDTHQAFLSRMFEIWFQRIDLDALAPEMSQSPMADRTEILKVALFLAAGSSWWQYKSVYLSAPVTLFRFAWDDDSREDAGLAGTSWCVCCDDGSPLFLTPVKYDPEIDARRSMPTLLELAEVYCGDDWLLDDITNELTFFGRCYKDDAFPTAEQMHAANVAVAEYEVPLFLAAYERAAANRNFPRG